MGELVDFEPERKARKLYESLVRKQAVGLPVTDRLILRLLGRASQNLDEQRAILSALRRRAQYDRGRGLNRSSAEAVYVSFPLVLASIAEKAMKSSISPKQAVR